MHFSKYVSPLISMFLGAACNPVEIQEQTDVATAALRVPSASDCTPNRGDFRSERVSFAVTLLNGSSATLVGYIYNQGTYNERTLLVAAHGTSYGHQYWTAPSVNGHIYSFSCYMAYQHYAVLALDLLGTGESSGEGQFDGDQLSYDDSRHVLNQVVSQLRTGSNPLRSSFSKIVLVGHSLGAETVLGVQAENHPADALVLTGWSHIPPSTGVNLDFSPFLGTPYIHLPNPVRNAVAYSFSADPAMVAYDNNNMADVLPRGLFVPAISKIYQASQTGATTVTGKVLSQLGENDILFPAAGAGAESASFPQAQLTVQTLPTVGHAVNLHPENLYGWAQMSEWLRSNNLK